MRMVKTAQEVGHVGEGEDEGDAEQHLALVPPDRLLMPKPRDDAEHREGDADQVEGRLALAVGPHRLQLAMLDAVVNVDVEADQHPEHQADPGVGGQEDHHHHAGDDAADGHEGHPGRLERAGGVGHGATNDQHPGAYQREGEQRADAAHLARYAGGHEGRQEADQHHEEQVAAGGRAIGLMDV